jgi:putative ABC transport system permease protein
VRTFGQICYDPDSVCRSVHSGTPQQNLCPRDRAAEEGRKPTPAELEISGDPRCSGYAGDGYSSSFSGPVVGSYADFVRLTGIRSDAARRVLDAGGVVVFQPTQVRDGKGVLDVTEQKPKDTEPGRPRHVEVPAAYVDARGKRFIDAFVASAAAQRLGVAPTTEAMVLQYRTPPSDNTEERVRAALAKIGQDSYFQVERGYRDHYGLGLLGLLLGSAVITLGGAGIATGLAQADARADHATLAAIGSPPRVRRSLAAWQAAVVAGLGTVLGAASGFVPMTAYLYAEPDVHLVIPWRNLAVIAVVVPLVAALGAWLLTRSRLPLERRLEA